MLNDPPPEAAAPRASAAAPWYANLLYLSFPVWGIIASFGLLSLLPRSAQVPGEFIVLLGALAPVVGARPIFRMSGAGTLGKLLLFAVYYTACAVAMFVVGWASLGLFGLIH